MLIIRFFSENLPSTKLVKYVISDNENWLESSTSLVSSKNCMRMKITESSWSVISGFLGIYWRFFVDAQCKVGVFMESAPCSCGSVNISTSGGGFSGRNISSNSQSNSRAPHDVHAGDSHRLQKTCQPLFGIIILMNLNLTRKSVRHAMHV